MAASSTCAAFLTAFKAALAARFAVHGTLSAVRVDLIPTGDTSSIDSVILLRPGVPVRGQQEYAAMSNRRADAYEIPGVIHTYATGPDSDVAFQASMDKAALILDELILELRDNKQLAGSDPLMKNRVTDIEYEALSRDQGGWVTRCEYTVEYGSLVT